MNNNVYNKIYRIITVCCIVSFAFIRSMEENPLSLYQNGWILTGVTYKATVGERIKREKAYLEGYTFDMTDECCINLIHEKYVSKIDAVEAENIMECNLTLPYKRGEKIGNNISTLNSDELGNILKEWNDRHTKPLIYLQLKENKDCEQRVELEILGKIMRSNIRNGKQTTIDQPGKLPYFLKVFIPVMVVGISGYIILYIAMKQGYCSSIYSNMFNK